jgi:hypothetical protein
VAPGGRSSISYRSSPPEAAEDRSVVVIEEHMRRLNAAVRDAQIVKVGHSGRQRGAESRYRTNAFDLQRGEIALARPAETKDRRWIGSIGAEQLHDAGVSSRPEHRRLVSQPPAAGRRWSHLLEHLEDI